MKKLIVSSSGIRRNEQGGCDPNTIAFVYFPGGEIMLVGWATEVRHWIETNYPIAIIATVYHGKDRKGGFYWSTIKHLHIHKYDPLSERSASRYFRFNFHSKTILKLRRIPKRWIPEYNQFLIPPLKRKPIAKYKSTIIN